MHLSPLDPPKEENRRKWYLSIVLCQLALATECVVGVVMAAYFIHAAMNGGAEMAGVGQVLWGLGVIAVKSFLFLAGVIGLYQRKRYGYVIGIAYLGWLIAGNASLLFEHGLDPREPTQGGSLGFEIRENEREGAAFAATYGALIFVCIELWIALTLLLSKNIRRDYWGS